MSEQELRQKIIELESENARLHDRLVMYKANEIQNKDHALNLFNYYHDKYLDMFNEIQKTRIDEVNFEISDLEENVKILADEEEGLLQIISENENVYAEVRTIEADIQALYLKYEAETFELSNEIKKLNQSINEYYDNYYHELKKLDDVIDRYMHHFASDIELNNLIEHYTYFIKVKSYPKLKPLKRNESLYDQKNKQLTDLDEYFKKEINILKDQQTTLEEEIKETSLTDQKTKYELTLTRLNNKKIFLEELTQLLTNLNNKHLNQIRDEMTKMQLQEATSKEIVSYFDQLLENLKKELLGVDTVSNQKERKIQRLEILQENFNKLQIIENKRQEVEGEYNHLQTIYLAIKQSLNEVEVYLDNSFQAIKSNSLYQLTFENIKKLEQDMSNYQLEQVNIQDDLRQYKRQRDILVRDPYAKEKLRELDEKVQELNKRREDLLLLVENTIHARENIISSPENFNLIQIINERKECENRVPLIYDRLTKLKELIDVKYDELENLKLEVKDYYNLAKQIEELQNEINN